MIAQRLPEVGIADQVHIFRGLTISQAITNDFGLTASPALVATAGQINLAIHNAVTTLETGLNRAIRINDAASTAELHPPFKPMTVRSDYVHPVLKCACHPPATG